MSRSPWLTIVVYHYVRGSAPAARPGYRGPTPASFCGQMDYIGRHYQVVTAEQVMSALDGGAALPKRAAWLTFDDGYREHYDCVLPELLARGWQGTFFPVGQAAEGTRLLDVRERRGRASSRRSSGASCPSAKRSWRASCTWESFSFTALREAGMCLGGHSWSHPRLTRLTAAGQEEEIERSLAFLRTLGVGTDRWIMAYPHGDPAAPPSLPTVAAMLAA